MSYQNTSFSRLLAALLLAVALPLQAADGSGNPTPADTSADATPAAAPKELYTYDASWLNKLASFDSSQDLQALCRQHLGKLDQQAINEDEIEGTLTAFCDDRLVGYLLYEDEKKRHLHLEWLHRFFAPALFQALQAKDGKGQYLPFSQARGRYNQAYQRAELFKRWRAALASAHTGIKSATADASAAQLRAELTKLALGERPTGFASSNRKQLWIGGLLVAATVALLYSFFTSSSEEELEEQEAEEEDAYQEEAPRKKRRKRAKKRPGQAAQAELDEDEL